MAQPGRPLEFRHCDKEMTNDLNNPCEDVLRNVSIGQGGFTHLRPDFMQGELARVPDFAIEFGSKIAVIDPFDPKLQAVA